MQSLNVWEYIKIPLAIARSKIWTIIRKLCLFSFFLQLKSRGLFDSQAVWHKTSARQENYFCFCQQIRNLLFCDGPALIANLRAISIWSQTLFWLLCRQFGCRVFFGKVCGYYTYESVSRPNVSQFQRFRIGRSTNVKYIKLLDLPNLRLWNGELFSQDVCVWTSGCQPKQCKLSFFTCSTESLRTPCKSVPSFFPD